MSTVTLGFCGVTLVFYSGVPILLSSILTGIIIYMVGSELKNGM